MYHLNSDDFVILYSGRIAEEKGVFELIKAFQALSAKYNDLKLMIVGCCWFPNIMKSPYMDRIMELNFNLSRVIFVGYIPMERLAYYYGIADVVAIPSIWDEPFGMVALEAMALSKPIITTDSGGIVEVADCSFANLISRKKLDEQMIKAIMFFYENRDEGKKMGQTGNKKLMDIVHFHKSNYYMNFTDKMNE